jgi:hypothetical protein
MRTKKTLAGLIIMITISFAGFAFAAASWEPITGNEHNMVVFGRIVAGVNFSSGSTLYSFGPAGDQDCRSKSDIGTDGSYYATILGNHAGETIHFRVVDGTGNVYDLQKTLLFEPDLSREKLDLY